MYVLPRSRNPPSPGHDQNRWSSVPVAGGACAAGALAPAPAACCSPLSAADAGAPRKGLLKRRMNSAAELDLLRHAPSLLSQLHNVGNVCSAEASCRVRHMQQRCAP